MRVRSAWITWHGIQQCRLGGRHASTLPVGPTRTRLVRFLLQCPTTSSTGRTQASQIWPISWPLSRASFPSRMSFTLFGTFYINGSLSPLFIVASCLLRSSVPPFLSVHWRWRWHSIQAASIFSSMSPACSLSKEFCVTTHTSRHSRARIRHPSPLGLSCVSRAYIEISRIEGISRCLACARNGGIGGSVCVLILVHVLPFSVVHLALLSLSPDPQLIHTRIHALLRSKYHPHSHRTSAQQAH